MKKAIFVWILAIMLILSGCTGNPDPNVSSVPSESVIVDNINDDNSSDIVDDSSDDITSEDDSDFEDLSTDDDNSYEDSWDDSEWDDEDWDDSIWDDIGWNDSVNDDSTEGGTISYYKEELPETHTTAYLLGSIKGGADKEAETLRKSIENSEDNLNITGQKYYISSNGDDNADGKTPETAWKTLDNISSNTFLFKKGDAILLERGGVYRINSTVLCQSGMTYAAYGEGEKPLVYGSAKNYAWGTEWKPSRKKNVWKLDLDRTDAGIIVFDHGKAVGTKKTNVNLLKSDGDFYHNTNDKVLYLYLEGAYPNVKYKSIEIGTNNMIFTVPKNASNVVIDNISFKYTGAHAINVSTNASNISITNCELGWIGGSYLDPVLNPGLRYGNAIQYWLSCENMLVENCYIYQVYDTGFSYQGNGNYKDTLYKNITVKNNLIEFCTMSIEVWDDTSGVGGTVENVSITDNILRFSGYGWGKQRPNPEYSTHFTNMGIKDDYVLKNLVVSNNIFDCSLQNLVYYRWPTGIERDIRVSGNTFYQSATKTNNAIYYAHNDQLKATNAEELLEAVKTFDPNPKHVAWIS